MREPLGTADFPGSSRGNNLRVFVVHWTAAGGCHRARTAKVIRRHLRGSEVVMKTGYFGKQISFPPLLWVVPEWREFGVPSATRPRNTPVAIGLGRPGNFTAVFTRLLSRRIGGCKPPVGQPIPPSGGLSHANGDPASPVPGHKKSVAGMSLSAPRKNRTLQSTSRRFCKNLNPLLAGFAATPRA